MPKNTAPNRLPKRAAKPSAEKPLPPPAESRASSPIGAPAPLPVVGIGASAGGLDAFTALLRNLPADTGIAFVIIQHLDPKHGSILVDLLSKATTMPVEEAKDGTKVEPNHVYVTPPNLDVVIRDGTLGLRARTRVRGMHMPIDSFFRSLAEDARERAIGVILSGASSDGALGIEAVKREGGITFVHDDNSAKYDVMPRAAIATGFVDCILPPDGIAREIARLASHPYVQSLEDAAGPAGPAETAKSEPLTRIFSLLGATTSVDFSHYKHTTIRRRIGRRMALHKLDKLEDYVSLLEKDTGELESLYREILIKVTSFFRDPEMFSVLKNKVFPDIVSRLSPDMPIRIWAPGCATGEEAYSIAITLLEFLSEKNLHPPIQIFATDISDDALDRARAGVYVENIALDVSPERLRRFFVKSPGGYQVSKVVRDLCVFARQNIAKDPPFSKLDLISCRNVLIYLEPVLQKRIIPMFRYALKPNGYLLLGGSESIGSFSDAFKPADKTHRIFFKRHIAGRQRFDFESGSIAAGLADLGPRNNRSPEEPAVPDIRKEADRLVLTEYGPPGVIINEDYEVIQFRGKTSPYLEPAPGKASLNLLKMLREGLLLEVRNAVQKVKRTGEAVKKKGVATKQDRGFTDVDFDVLPLPPTTQRRHYLVLFCHSEAPTAPPKGKKGAAEADRQVEQIKQELVATRQYLRSIIEEQGATNEELQSANEEILSSNEELQRINEELETAKEELQSTNEELTTVNEELRNRNLELSQTNDDLNNLLASVNMAIVMLSSDLRIRRFTPMAGRVLNLIPADIGRPITDLRPAIHVTDLGDRIHDVLETVTGKDFDVADNQGHWYSMAIRPYRTADNRIGGAVLTLVDIESIRRGFDPGRAYGEFVNTMLELSQDPMAIVDLDGYLRHTNRGFREVFDLDGDGVGIQAPGAIRLFVEAVARDREDGKRPIPAPDGAAPMFAAGTVFATPEGRDLVLLRLSWA
jgi:two-component system CheB/CheR fusion protein